MGWQPLPEEVTTLAEILAQNGLHTAASVDTPYYLRNGMNYDRGFQSFFMNTGQDTLWSLIQSPAITMKHWTSGIGGALNRTECAEDL